MLKILTALGAAALAASALSTPAAAAPEDNVSVVVSYAGLDPAKPADAARLDRRLRAAAHAICREASVPDLDLARQTAECEAGVLGRGKSELQLAMQSGRSRTLALRTN